MRATQQSGFTLVEAIVAAALSALVLLGGLGLFTTAINVASRSSAQVSSTERGSVAVARVLDMSRECYGLALPTDSSGFTVPVSGTTTANYITTDGSAAAIQLTAPSTAAVTVVDSAGTSHTAGTNFPMTFTNTAGPSITLYRSDSAGNPQPNTGQYLWEVGTPPGQSALPSGGIAMERLLETPTIASNTPDAVTFVRTTDSTATMPSVEIHIVAGDYSAQNGSMTNENSQNQVVGKCVLLRNHP